MPASTLEPQMPVAVLAPVSKSGVVAGLSTRQLAVCLVGIAPVAYQAFSQNLGGALKWFAVFSLPMLVLGAVSWRGRSLLSRVETMGVFTLRKMTGRTKVRGRDLITKEGFIGLPGAIDERIRVLSMVGTPFDGGCFIWDRVTQCATAVIRVETQAWNFAPAEQKLSRIDALGRLCQDVANLGGVTGISMLAETFQGHPSELPAPRRATERWTAEEYYQMLDTSVAGQVWHRDVLITVTVSRKEVRKEVAALGGGRLGMAAVLADRMSGLYAKLLAMGVRDDSATWLNAREVRGRVRIAFDPPAGVHIATQGGQLHDDVAVCAGYDEAMNVVITPSAMIRTLWVERFPGKGVRAGFLSEVIDSGAFPHTVTVLFRPSTLSKSEKDLANAEQSHRSKGKMYDAVGKAKSAAHEAEGKELELRRQELGAGFGETQFSVYVVITAPPGDKLTLKARETWVAEKLPGTMLTTTYGDQVATFITAALPLGIGQRA